MIRIEGRLRKAGKWRAVEIPALRIHTQGTSRANALAMARDAVRELSAELDVDIPITVEPGAGDEFYVASPDVAGLLAFILKRQRSKAGFSIRAAAKRLGSTSPTAYARYEKGLAEPGLSKVNALIEAVAPGASLVISIVK